MLLVSTQQFLNGPFDREISKVRVVLSDTDKEDGHICCVYKTDERADHVANSVTLGNDEAV